MKIYKNISVFKKDNVEGNKPTHDVVASEANFENKVTVASLWTKDGSKGKFLSGSMKNEYKSEKGTYPAYVIVQEDELNALIAKAGAYEPKTDLEKINNETNIKLFGKEMTAEDHEAMSNMVF